VDLKVNKFYKNQKQKPTSTNRIENTERNKVRKMTRKLVQGLNIDTKSLEKKLAVREIITTIQEILSFLKAKPTELTKLSSRLALLMGLDSNFDFNQRNISSVDLEKVQEVIYNKKNLELSSLTDELDITGIDTSSFQKAIESLKIKIDKPVIAAVISIGKSLPPNSISEKSGLRKSIYAVGFTAVVIGAIGNLIYFFKKGLASLKTSLGLLTVFGLVTTEAIDFDRSLTKRLISIIIKK
jgi:hypothetical protein